MMQDIESVITPEEAAKRNYNTGKEYIKVGKEYEKVAGLMKEQAGIYVEQQEQYMRLYEIYEHSSKAFISCGNILTKRFKAYA